MPIEITLVQTELETYLVAFDGRVVEIFDTLSAGKTRRYHAALLAGVGINTDKKGKHTLVVQTPTGFKDILVVTDDKLPVAQQLVAEAQQAMAKDR
jgi:hypothetical protein